MSYVVTATWTARPGHEATVREALEKLTPLSRQEPGNQFYQAYQDPDEPLVFRLFEIYDDEQAYAAHGTSEHFKEYGHDLAIPLLESRVRAFYETIG